MKHHELIELIQSGESINVEFKQKFSEHEKIAKEIIAFANTKGGKVIFGISDNGKILGVESEKEIIELVKETINDFCEPKVEYENFFFNVKNKEIVVVEIPESENKPHRIKDYKTNLDINTAQIYVRVNDKSVPAGKEMIKLLQKKSTASNLKNYSVGKNEKKVFEYLSDNDFITAKILSQIANLSSRRASRTLINLVRANILNIHTKDNGEHYFSNR